MFAPFYWIALQTLLKESSDEENLGIMGEGDQAAVLVSVPLFHVTGSHAIFCYRFLLAGKQCSCINGIQKLPWT